MPYWLAARGLNRTGRYLPHGFLTMLFAWGDTVQIRQEAPSELHPGEIGSVCGISEVSGEGGLVLQYTIEFADGSSVEVPDRWVRAENLSSDTSSPDKLVQNRSHSVDDETQSVRTALLKRLINFEKPLNVVINELRGYPWDSDPLVVLDDEAISHVLQMHLSGEVSATELQEWAEAIEMRDDIELPQDREEMTKKFLFRFANPAIEGPIHRALAEEWLSVYRN